MTDDKVTETKPFHEQQILWPLTTGYTILYLGIMVADFALRDAFTMPAGMMIVYVALVTAYAGDKKINFLWVEGIQQDLFDARRGEGFFHRGHGTRGTDSHPHQ